MQTKARNRDSPFSIEQGIAFISKCEKRLFSFYTQRNRKGGALKRQGDWIGSFGRLDFALIFFLFDILQHDDKHSHSLMCSA